MRYRSQLGINSWWLVSQLLEETRLGHSHNHNLPSSLKNHCEAYSRERTEVPLEVIVSYELQHSHKSSYPQLLCLSHTLHVIVVIARRVKLTVIAVLGISSNINPIERIEFVVLHGAGIGLALDVVASAAHLAASNTSQSSENWS